jgi:hypothetical protein
MLRHFFTAFLTLSWLLVANHCFLAGALAAPVQPAHHCCKPGDGSAPTPPHDSCPKKVCCESFSPMTAHLELGPPVLALDLIATLFTGEQLLVSAPAASAWPAGLPQTLGPPGLLPTLVRSLTLAQNAPPLHSRKA